MKSDDLSDLTVFLTVAEERSFTRAGKRLGVSPSAVSHAMRSLEEHIGVRLLSRTTRSVAPTPAGEQLLAALAGEDRRDRIFMATISLLDRAADGNRLGGGEVDTPVLDLASGAGRLAGRGDRTARCKATSG